MSVRNKVQLITYVDRLGGGDLSVLHTLLNDQFRGLFGGLHILPFYEKIDGEDAGFDPIDHRLVDHRLGDWHDINLISQQYDVMADLIVNHISSESPHFRDYFEKGDASEYSGMFLRFQDIFPDGATEDQLKTIYRPRPSFPFTRIKFSDREELFWTTFSSNQIDINIHHEKSKQYIDEITSRFESSGVNMVRLDAVGYVVKKPGSSCFMTDETVNYISDFAKSSNVSGMELLVELHTHYKRQIAIASHVDRVYDFALPPLVLHSLYSEDGAALKKWIDIRPTNCFTVLDTHDGIGIIDIAPECDEQGLLGHDEIDHLIEGIHLRSGGESRMATGAAANNLDLYQINCTFYSALGKDDNDYLLARLIQFILPGIPQVYYVGLLAGINDTELLAQTKVGRDINRHYYTSEELELEFARPVVANLFGLIKFRNFHPAFNGKFSLRETADDSLLAIWVAEHAELVIDISLSDKSFSIVSNVSGRERVYTKWSDFERHELEENVSSDENYSIKQVQTPSSEKKKYNLASSK